jgi:hypothetical protein
MLAIPRRVWLAFIIASSLALAAPGGPPLCTAADWVDGRLVGPFLCRADFPLGGLENLFAELRQLHGDLVRHLALPPAREAIELYLFHDQETYLRYLQRYFPELPYRRALYVKKNGPGMVFAFWSHRFDVDLRHECTHALLHAMLPEIPLWLDEGLAEYFETAAPQRAFDNPHLASIRCDVRSGGVPELESLEKITDLSGMGRLEYRNAWAWTHFMLHGDPEAHEELVGYLRAIRSHKTPGLLSTRLRQRWADPAQRFAAHFGSWKR